MGTIAKLLIGGMLAFVLIGMGGFRFLSAYVAIIEAGHDNPKDFQSFTSEQHYVAAIALCKGPHRRPDQYDDDCLLAPQDFSRVIHHLEAIPDDRQVYGPNAVYLSVYEDAVRALRLIEIQRDRPQDFESARAADFRQCMADRSSAVGDCGNGLADICNLFSIHRAENRLISAALRDSH